MSDTHTPKVDVLEKALSVFTMEQFTMAVDALCRAQERAVERDQDQRVTIFITRKGHPDTCDVSDCVKFPKPKEIHST